MVICRAIVMAQDSDSSMYKVYRAQRDREGASRTFIEEYENGKTCIRNLSAKVCSIHF